MHGLAAVKVARRTGVTLTNIGLALLLFSGALNVNANADANKILPDLPRGKGENCVEPTELMRKNHIRYLTHQRDLTVRFGLRPPRHSLVGCVQCHAQKNSQGRFIAVDAPGQFCQSCHAFTGVKLDCFECHATTPDTEADMTDGHAHSLQILHSGVTQ